MAVLSLRRRVRRPGLVEEVRRIDASRIGVIVCDVWDHHWCAGAERRVGEMVPRIERVISAARNQGAFIVHAPSGTMGYYSGTDARERALSATVSLPPAEIPHDDPALPIDDVGGGCDTRDNRGRENQAVWTRQHKGLTIDNDRDAVSDDGLQILSLMRERGLDHVVLLGVHTNMCILNRSFAIKQMVRWGMDIMLCRDLTDAMYDPACAPYVTHDDGTRLVIEHIERHWCPTIDSDDILNAKDHNQGVSQ